MQQKFLGRLLCLFFLPFLSLTGPLDDFKEAARHTVGIELIPFKDLKREATPIARDVDNYKKAATPYNAPVLEPQKINLLKEIKKINDQIKVLEDEAKKYPGTKPDQRRIDKLIAERTTYDNKLKKVNEDIADGYEAWDKFHDARVRLRLKFKEVLNELEVAEKKPEKYLGSVPSASDVKELKGYISTIEKNIKIQEIIHQEQEDGALNTKNKFQELKQLD